MVYPLDSIQAFDESQPWWEHTDSKAIERGSLIWAFLPYVDQVPYEVVPRGRKEPTLHDRAYVTIKPLDIKKTGKRSDLPVAAMPLGSKEVWSLYRAKKRPSLVLAKTKTAVDRSVLHGNPRKNIAPSLIVAPYFGVDQEGNRAGYPPEFVERVRHIWYPQFFWDMLPISGTSESLLRFEQTQPVGYNYLSYETTGYKLSEYAMSVIDEVFHFYLNDNMLAEGILKAYQDVIKALFYD
ncbi:hypothetical protein [Desulfotignum phosphitoxidans]|uniref:Uncharacterized protein n=1 Tax=Desulfotignum phosphitoxidans DSM 13687 TaxID=1286635 RepID=S0FWS7_9BACT|nr:hypothetical protein [Desulfotignum phosphitoxidans]EMS79165.1 hypothetical protein Dpo_5c00880 [Desulfotignum phosphitoxidans DSM 13687]